jgi:hypothetical protein
LSRQLFLTENQEMALVVCQGLYDCETYQCSFLFYRKTGIIRPVMSKHSMTSFGSLIQCKQPLIFPSSFDWLIIKSVSFFWITVVIVSHTHKHTHIKTCTVSFRDLDCRSWDDYFWVDFDHFWLKLHFFRQLARA